FLCAFLLIHFRIPRNHLCSPLPEPRHVQHSLHCRSLTMRAKPPQQLVQPHHADFRVLQCPKMEQILELFFELLLRFLLHRQRHSITVILQHVGDVVGSSLRPFPVFRDQLPPQLIDLRRRPARRGDLPRRLQNQFLLRLLRIVHRTNRGIRIALSASVPRRSFMMLRHAFCRFFPWLLLLRGHCLLLWRIGRDSRPPTAPPF